MALTLCSRWLARLVATVHYGYLGYLLSGGFLAWRYPRTFPAHLVTAAWAVVVVATPAPCPLTASQNRLRLLAGLQPLPISFMASYVEGRCYPKGRDQPVQLAAAGLVLTSWLGLLGRHLPRQWSSR